MKEQIIGWLLLLITGLFTGLSCGLGFWPIYEQPKNIRIQFLFGMIAIAGMILLVYKYW